MILIDTVQKIVESYLSTSNHYLVDLNISQDNRISIEIDHFDGVSIDYCVELSRHLESQLDRETEDFELNISSAGLTEAFKVRKQYEKNIGREVEVIVKDGMKHSGILHTMDEHTITLLVKKQIKPEGAKRKKIVEEELQIHFENIKSTKYIIRFK